MTEINTALVTTLIGEQFPQWAGLPITPVEPQGWDNRTFRLGEQLCVRLPSASHYAAAIAKEDTVLPLLAAALPLPVPEPVATGAPGPTFPFPWSVRRWLQGTTLDVADDVDHVSLARDLAAFLNALRATPTEQGPAAGRQSFFRGCHPSVYSDEVDRALNMLAGRVDVQRCRQIWLEAITTVWAAPPVWSHGDLDVGNVLVRDGRISAVIDFGCCAVGDPACDLAMAWTFFSDPARHVFHESLDLDAHTWRRARGWVLWKALITLANTPEGADPHQRHLAEVLHAPMP